MDDKTAEVVGTMMLAAEMERDWRNMSRTDKLIIKIGGAVGLVVAMAGFYGFMWALDTAFTYVTGW